MPYPVLSGIGLRHNAIFVVHPLTPARGSGRAIHFSDPSRVIDVIREARAYGAGGMMMSTHERAMPVAELIAADSVLSRDWRVYPLLPYVQKYVTRSNEVGMVNVIVEMLSGTTISDRK